MTMSINTNDYLSQRVKKTLFVFLLTSIVNFGFAQKNADELKFIEHLIHVENFKEAIFLLDKDTLSFNAENDSANYYKGWAYYSMKELEKSTDAFLKVGVNSSFYQKSRFFAGYNYAYLGDYMRTERILNDIPCESDLCKTLVNFELCGINMLQGNLEKSKELLCRINPDVAVVSHQVMAFEKIMKEKELHRSKSPIMAGILSGIIPGSGKFYAGKKGQGIASFIATTGFGLITWENYHKLGIKNPKTLFFGSIFIANYVSNIYGSVISVKVIENEYNNAIQNQILFQLHIPLRNVFEE